MKMGSLIMISIQGEAEVRCLGAGCEIEVMGLQYGGG
jgi:hypothetical protein